MRQRTRTFLTMFGIIWGIAAVIILVAIIQGFKSRNQQFFAGVGVNKLLMEYSDTYELNGIVYPLEHDISDKTFILKYCPNIEAATIEVSSYHPMERVRTMEGGGGGGVLQGDCDQQSRGQHPRPGAGEARGTAEA